MKKGQVTIFIILGILILGIVLGFMFLVKGGVEEELEVEKEEALPADVAGVKLFVESCLEQTIHDAIYLVSGQGGYYETPELYFDYVGFKIPYYFDQEPLKVPNRELTKNEIKNYVEDNLDGCLEDFNNFPTYEIVVGERELEVEIAPQKVIVWLKMSLQWQIGDKNNELKMFQVESPAELGQAMELSAEIVEIQKERPNQIRMSDLVEMGDEGEMFIDLVHVNNTVFYKLKYPNSVYNKGDYLFTFAMKYNWT